MLIVIAPDKFKGSLAASEVAAAVAAGLAEVVPDAEIDLAPVADGGEGTVDAALANGFRPLSVAVTGPLGDPLAATIAVRDRIAVIEMAAASGLGVLPVEAGGAPRRDALAATSSGTGQLIRAALDAGCSEIVLGVGGSATTDGGAGLISALGALLLDESGADVPPGGGGLGRLASVDLSGLDPRVRDTTFTLAADVTNPLLGPRGAAAVFGPQKGASPSDVQLLDRHLARLVDRLVDVIGAEARALAAADGAGAAGGVGYAALAVLGAERRPGIDVVLDLVRLPQRLAGADAVITGEGSLDDQSLGGKTPLGVARAARAHGVPVVIAVCGRTTLSAEQAAAEGFDAVNALSDLEPDLGRSMSHAAELLQRVGALIGEQLLGNRLLGNRLLDRP